ncbi:amidase family protein [Rhodococcus sp. 3A]|nr:amidase family protein [Rhodococcus sp. 3A]
MASHLATREWTATDLFDRALSRTNLAPAASALITTTIERGHREARASDRRRRADASKSPLDGVPIVWKDVFDVAGTVTTAGSQSRTANPPAEQDSSLVRRTHRRGLVTVGKANLSEFAFSGLGVNTYFGTPVNPNSTDTPLVPGGSSSGSAAAVAAGLAPLAVGTDTSGSIRVPAAFCGLVGFRASPGRYGPHDFLPLSVTLDSIGIIAHTLSDIDALDRVLTVTRTPTTTHTSPRVIIPAGEWIEDCTPEVRMPFERATMALTRAGIDVTTKPIAAMIEAQHLMDSHGTIVGAEAHALHGHLLPFAPHIEAATLRRLEQNQHPRSQLQQVFSNLADLRRRFGEELDGALLLCPTVRHDPPPIHSLLNSASAYDRYNASTLRTTMLLSYLGTCGLSYPLRAFGNAAAGMLFSQTDTHDDYLLAMSRRLLDLLQLD